MGEKLIVGPVGKGLRTNVKPFYIDNDSFPALINAYEWRGRIKRKRGTSLLNRLQRYFSSASSSYGTITSITLDTNGQGNILTGFDLEPDGNITPGTVSFTDSTASVTYTDPSEDGSLSPSGTIDYASGLIDIGSGNASHVIDTVSFFYYPDLPVMGLRDLNLDATEFPGTLGFDTTYSYNILTIAPYNIYDVSFYKNPKTSESYTSKTTVTPTSWNGQTYQQFWTVNYQGALWATNGIIIPFTVANDIGMQFQKPDSATWVDATTMTFVITDPCPLVVGDWVFANEWIAMTSDNSITLNLQTGYVTVHSDDSTETTITVVFPDADITDDTYSGGLLQYLTNRSDTSKDCLRWYDGDPTMGYSNPPSLAGHLGWVNYAPPLSNAIFAVGELPLAQYYLVGARMIVPFKDRLLFIGPVVQTSSANSQVYLQDTVIYTQNGTPYYTASFSGDPTLVDTEFTPLLVPTNQTATPTALFEDIAGFGGFISAGYAQPITSVSYNEDVLIMGFTTRQTRFVYTGTDLIPFNFYVINSEFGSSSTFSYITLDRGVYTIGPRGIVLSMQISSERIDLDIPDQIFEFNLNNNGTERVTAARDFINEWIYFSYLSNQSTATFPNQTLQYNYRENTWAIFNESYTSYGTFRPSTGYTWSNIGDYFPTWSQWTEPWNAGSRTLLQQKVIAGNQQGFVLFRDEGTGEGNSLYIQNVSTSGKIATITSPDHGLNNGDYIVISGCLGTISDQLNNVIFKISTNAGSTDSFTVSIEDAGTYTYLGGGLIKRMYVPYIQSRQFPTSWGAARKTRIGPQQYLFTVTEGGQVTLQIFLSQNATGQNITGSNQSNIVPSSNVTNSSLVYSAVLYTCLEDENIGLTPANINLLMFPQSQQVWHRMNTSLIGDTVQIGFTLSDAQMTDVDFKNQFTEIELHGFVLDLSPSQVLA